MRLPPDIEIALIAAKKRWSREEEQEYLLSAGYCALCDVETAARCGSDSSRRLPLQKSHSPFPRGAGTTFHYFCNEHNLEATANSLSVTGPRQDAQVQRLFGSRTRLDADEWAARRIDMESLLELPCDTRRVHALLYDIRRRHQLSLQQFKEYAITAAGALYRDNECRRAYDLLRHANELEFRKTPMETQLRLQVTLANCLRRMGSRTLSAHLFFITARCAVMAGVSHPIPALDPALRLGESFLPQELEGLYRDLLVAAREMPVRGGKEERRIHADTGLARLDRGRDTRAWRQALTTAVKESSPSESRHRVGNLMQAEAIHGAAEDETPTRLEILAHEWEQVSPFHEALALARAGVASIGFGSLRGEKDLERLERARDWFGLARDRFEALANDGFYLPLSEILLSLHESVDGLGPPSKSLIEYCANAERMRAAGLGSFLDMPGPVLVAEGQWQRLRKAHYRADSDTGFFPRLVREASGVRFENSRASLLNWY